MQETAQVGSKLDTYMKTSSATNYTVHTNISSTTFSYWEKLQETDPDNAACCSARYTDLGGMDPLTHYQTVGAAQGRLWTCSKNMTMLQAEDYLWRYPDLQHAFGGAFSDVYYEMAAKHFKTYGKQENRDGNRGTGEEEWLCQDGSNTHLYDYKAECTCTNTLIIGLGVRPDNGAAITSFEEMR